MRERKQIYHHDLHSCCRIWLSLKKNRPGRWFLLGIKTTILWMPDYCQNGALIGPESAANETGKIYSEVLQEP